MPLFTCILTPKKSAPNDVISLACAVDAKTARIAAMKAEMLLEETYPELSNHYFKPKVCADRVGLPCPKVGELCADFMKHNQWNDETKEIEPISLDEHDNEENDDITTKSKSIFDLPVDARVAYILLYGSEPDVVDMGQLSNAYDLINDDEAEPHLRAIIDGLLRVPQVKSMLVSSVEKLIDAIQAHTPTLVSWPDVVTFAEKWIHTPHSERQHSQDENISALRTYDMLDTEIALAINGVNPLKACASDVKNAKDIINKRNQVWRAWSTSFRIVPGILEIDREIIFEIITAGLKHDIFSTDASARKEFVRKCLTERCGMIFEDSTQQSHSHQAENQETENTTTTPETSNNKPVVQTMASPATEANTSSSPQENEKNATERNSTNLPDECHTSDNKNDCPTSNFQQRANDMEQAITNKSEEAQGNLHIWKQVQRTDPQFTQKLDGVGYAGTSINAEYMFMRATELFGPTGTGWGYEIFEDQMLPGAPMSEPIYEGSRLIGKRILRDGDGTLITGLNHSIGIRFWYLNNGERKEVISFGATPYLYMSNKSQTVCDGEAKKKSLTDAIKKALSMLGFSADIYLGYFDNPEYTKENAIEFDIKNATNKAEGATRLREELDEELKKVAETLRTAVTPNEADKILGSVARKIEAHRKNAQKNNDAEYEKYLGGRLKRLNQIKTERIAELEAQEETA
ncbi:transcription termination factor [Yersinia enterocolitica]|uniref:transcription termination factor n=1 Tax=Yersinia enterocolitica TaxID=630 RepID=UPI001C60D4D2|nr:transcription termination factor [Yersinia enterocolitica]MBW5853149.1 transcription termination factor [Yersinia enterocolitica]